MEGRKKEGEREGRRGVLSKGREGSGHTHGAGDETRLQRLAGRPAPPWLPGKRAAGMAHIAAATCNMIDDRHAATATTATTARKHAPVPPMNARQRERERERSKWGEME